MFAVEWLRRPEDLATIEAGWRALEETVTRRTHLSTFDFLAAWYRHYAGEYGGAPLVGVVRAGDRIVAVAPFAVLRGRMGHIPLTRIELAPTDVPAGECLVNEGHPQAFDAIVESLGQVIPFDVIALDGLAPASAELEAVERAAQRLGVSVEVEEHAHAVVDLRAGYAAYFNGLTGNTRRKLSQKSRRAGALGLAVEGVHLTATPKVVKNATARMIAITEASYKLAGQRLADHHRGFLTEIAERLAVRGALCLPILTIGARDAAFILGAVERGIFYDISIAYDEAFTTLSPGAILMQQLLARLADGGVRTVISHGAHEYKRRWASAFVAERRVFLFAPGIRPAAARFVRFGLAPLWHRLGRERAEEVGAATP